MVMNTRSALQQLQRLQHARDSGSSGDKLRLLRALHQGSLRNPDEIIRLHDLLCFMRAYPDNEPVLKQVERMLGDFHSRKDLTRHQRALADTGIAGTTIHFRFYWQTALWLFERWPDALSIDWAEWENLPALDGLWFLLLPDPAAEALESLPLSPRQWITKLKRAEETDAAFLIRHFINWRVEAVVREKFYDDLDVPLRLVAVNGSPSRTHAHYQSGKVFSSRAPYKLEIPISKLIREKPAAMKCVSVREGKKLIDLARVQMITRERDLYAFMHSDPRDVRLLSYRGGLQFVCYGLLPQRRSLLETMYVFIILKNGVPIGYTQAVTLLRSAEVNFNIFDSFRGAETSRIFVAALTMMHHLFASDAFVINTQQLGEGNQEALKSGAFWFYYKQGFRPRNANVQAIVRTELARRKAQPGHRSTLSTLRKLAGGDLYLVAGKARTDFVTTLATENISLKAAQVMERHASARSNGARQCMQRAMSLLEYRPTNRLSTSCRIAWERWSPVILSLPGVARWSPANKRALIEVVNAKGGRHESDFVILFDKHKLLRSAILKLSKKNQN